MKVFMFYKSALMQHVIYIVQLQVVNRMQNMIAIESGFDHAREKLVGKLQKLFSLLVRTVLQMWPSLHLVKLEK